MDIDATDISPPIPIVRFDYKPFNTREPIRNYHFEDLILSRDPSILSGISYNGIVTRYRARNVMMPSKGTYDAYSYTITFTNLKTFEFLVHTDFTFEEAEYMANFLPYQIGQVPAKLSSNLKTYAVFLGDGGGPSGVNVEHFLKHYKEVHRPEIGEYLVHALSHGVLDWLQEKPANNYRVSVIDGVTVEPQNGLIVKEEWLDAAAKDGYYISEYAEEHPEREDIADTIQAYLAVYWRPYRFDPRLIELLQDRFPNRFLLFDEIDFEYPENLIQ